MTAAGLPGQPGAAPGWPAPLGRIHGRQGLDQPPDRADVVVVGAGIVGLAAAHELARRQLRVTVIDGSTAGAAQSSRNWGFIRQQGRSVEELPLMIEANRMWRDMEATTGHSVEWVQGGNLRLTDDPRRADDYRRWIETARALGLDSREVGPFEVEAIVPGFKGDYAAAIFTPSDGQVNPVKAMRGYSDALRSMGVELCEGYPVRAVVTAGGRVAGVATHDGFIAAPVVVLAAGVGTRRLLRTVGLDVPFQFVSSTVALTTAVPRITSACVWTGRIGFRQTSSGSILLSAGGRGDIQLDRDALAALTSPRLLAQSIGMYRKNRHYLRIRPRELGRLFRAGQAAGLADEEVSYRDVAESFAALSETLPGIGCQVSTAWASTIDSTPDALPVIEAVNSPAGLVVAAGMSGHGFGIGPAVGTAIADLVTSGSNAHDLRPFQLSRFQDGRANAPQHLL